MTDSLTSTTDSNISELMKINESYTLVYWKKNYDQFVVAFMYDENKPDGQKWASGSYFHTLKDALRYIKTIYGINVYE